MGEDRFKNMLLWCDSTATPLSNIPDVTNTLANTTTIAFNPEGHAEIVPTVEAQDLTAVLFSAFNEKPKTLPQITDYAIYNNRVLIVYFEDGTFTKCVAESEAEFDFFTGLAFCLMKKLLGKDGHKRFNDMMRKAIKACGEIDKRHVEERAEAEQRKAKLRKAELKRAAKQAKARQEQIDMQSAAVLDAMRKFKADEGMCRE